MAIVAGGSKAINDANNQKHTIVYTVTGTGTPDISYSSYNDSNEGTSTANNVTLPWTKTVTGSGLFNLYDVTATNGSSGSITCTLTIDGKQVASHTATGELSTADCSGSSS